MANQKYTSIKNDYTIIFDRNSVIEPAKDDQKIKNIGFSFVNLEEINGFEQQRTVDVAGVILNVGSVSLFQPKDQTRAAKDKRTLTIADESGLKIQLTLWGKNATRLPFDEGRVIAIKGAKVSEYGGKSLNAGDEHSQLFLDPPGDKRCDELRKWYKSVTPEQLQ
jgi:replication factor A1